MDRNKKCRQSANAESILGNSCDPEEEAPPPVPVKLLDENENPQEKAEGEASEESAAEGTGETNKRFSSLSYKSREEDPTLTEEEISAMYSSVNKQGQSGNKSGQSLKAPDPGLRDRLFLSQSPGLLQEPHMFTFYCAGRKAGHPRVP